MNSPDGSQSPYAGPIDEGRIGQYFQTGWRIFKQYPLGFMGFTLIIWLVKLCPTFFLKKQYLIGLFLGIAIYPLHLGDYIVTAKLLQKQSCKFSNFFSGFHYYKSLIIFAAIVGLIGWLPYLLQQHLAIRLLGKLLSMAFFVIYLFTPIIIVDRRIGFWQAMELSRRFVQHQLFAMLVFLFFGFLILIAGVIPLGGVLLLARPAVPSAISEILVTLPLIFCAIPMLIAWPVVSAATTAAYADLFGLQSKEY
jgi:hypothetical protein